MKTILLSLMTLAVVGFTTKVQAQACVTKNPIVNINNAVVVPAGLSVNFDVTFDMDANGGDKAIFIQSWLTTDWPNYWQCNNGVVGLNPEKAPNNANWTSSFLKLAINNFNATPSFYATYPYYTGLLPVSTGASISKIQITILGVVYDRFTLTGIQVVVPGITSTINPVDVTTDVFSTNGTPGNGGTVQCANCGTRQFFNDPLIQGTIPCNNPRVVKFQLTSVRLSTQFYYRIYKDDGDGVFEKGGDDVDVTVGGTPTITTDASGLVPLVNYPIVQPPAGSLLGTYWVEVIQVGDLTGSGVFKKLTPLGGECAPLPVSFKSFTATRNHSNVIVKWETATEINNSGFAVERNINGTWEQVGFVPSQAANGTSASDLSYQFIDLNNTKGITQYRLKQIDIDAKSKYSDVRAVRGDGQIGKTIVYPNPSSDGKVNIVFEDANVSRDISVADMSGRTVKQIRGITANNLTIDNLTPGMYSLRIVVPSTGEQSVEKIVVNKR